jgi:hypothetical protein
MTMLGRVLAWVAAEAVQCDDLEPAHRDREHGG